MNILDRTFGLEIEYANVDKSKVILPAGFQWDEVETVHNTDATIGTYNSRYGGELNTRPMKLCHEDLMDLKKLIDSCRNSGAIGRRDSASLRTCAFGWWAGVVGTYNTIRLYCLKYNLCNLNKLDYHYSINELMAQIEIAKKALSNSNIRVVVTGNGKVSKGCQFILDKVSIPRLSVKDYLNVNECQKCYCVAETKDLVKRKDNGLYNRCDFHAQPSEYESLFILFAKRSNTFISCHEWEPNMPVYFDEYCMNHGKIRVVGDITCDINGSVKSTVRSSTHDNPFYDFSYEMMKEVPLFDDKDSISVMAVDTCPNSLAREASENFGSQIIINAIIPIIQDQFVDNVFNKAVLIRKGVPTSYFKYLNEYESINKENN